MVIKGSIRFFTLKQMREIPKRKSLIVLNQYINSILLSEERLFVAIGYVSRPQPGRDRGEFIQFKLYC